MENLVRLAKENPNFNSDENKFILAFILFPLEFSLDA